MVIDFFPWAHLRESLVMNEDEIAVDDVLVSVLKRVRFADRPQFCMILTSSQANANWCRARSSSEAKR